MGRQAEAEEPGTSPERRDAASQTAAQPNLIGGTRAPPFDGNIRYLLFGTPIGDILVAPLVIPLAALIAAGVGAAGKGVTDLVQANKTAKAAQRDHKLAVSAVEVCQGRTHEFAEDYGKDQLRAQAETIGRFAAWLEKNEHLVERLDRKVVAGVEVAVPSLPELKFDVEQARTGLTGGFGALGAAASAQGAALWGVSAFASASTGSAISGLSGAAATNATLAWLGGGSLAAGGGGMAAGAIVLNLIMIAPAAFITGITVGILGAKQKTKAREYAAKVAVSIENMETAKALLKSVDARISELQAVLSGLVVRAEHAVDELEVLDFDPDVHGADFLRALQLVTAIGEVIETPVLDPDTGQLTEVSIKIVEKYS
ncbi:hypothetical protein ACWD6N_31955 [Micromonospora sp. NPDC005163]